jgi:hypothetical protein
MIFINNFIQWLNEKKAERLAKKQKKLVHNQTLASTETDENDWFIVD